MHSFRASHNQVQWKLVVRSEVAAGSRFSDVSGGRPPGDANWAISNLPERPQGRIAQFGVVPFAGGEAMNEPEVIIRLDDNGRAYAPGASLSGEYRIEGHRSGNLQAVEVSVLWHSEGKGDEDLAVHEFWRKNADGGELGDPRRPDRFSTTLPQSPLSYDGQIVKIRWCVRVRVIFKRGRDLVAEKSFAWAASRRPKRRS